MWLKKNHCPNPNWRWATVCKTTRRKLPAFTPADFPKTSGKKPSAPKKSNRLTITVNTGGLQQRVLRDEVNGPAQADMPRRTSPRLWQIAIHAGRLTRRRGHRDAPVFR